MAQGDILSIIKNRPFNAIINGAMDYWQRGTSFNNIGSASYTADRFICFDTNISRQSFSVGQTSVPHNPKYFMRSDNTGRAGTFGAIAQRMEDISTVAGKQKTFSVYLNSAINGTIYFRSWYSFGAGSTTASRPCCWTPINVTTGWKRYILTVDFPPILSSDDLRSGNNAEATLDMYVPGTSADALGYTAQGLTPPTYVGQLDVSNMMLSDGPMAPEFERSGVSLANELQLCQRYFEKSSSHDIAPTAVSYPNSDGARWGNSLANVSLKTFFRIDKRVSPTIVLYDWVGNINRTHVNGIDNNTAFSIFWNGNTGFLVNTTVNTPEHLYHWTADAEL